MVHPGFNFRNTSAGCLSSQDPICPIPWEKQPSTYVPPALLSVGLTLFPMLVFFPTVLWDLSPNGGEEGMDSSGTQTHLRF